MTDEHKKKIDEEFKHLRQMIKDEFVLEVQIESEVDNWFTADLPLEEQNELIPYVVTENDMQITVMTTEELPVDSPGDVFYPKAVGGRAFITLHQTEEGRKLVRAAMKLAERNIEYMFSRRRNVRHYFNKKVISWEHSK